MKMSRPKPILLAAGLALAGVLAYFLFSDGPVDEGRDEAPRARKAKAAQREKVRRKVRPEAARETVREKADPDEVASAEMNAAMLNDDFEAAQRLAAEALTSANEEVRSDAAVMLGWFGAKGLPELTPFIADRNDRVRDEALGQWRNSLRDLDDDKAKGRVVAMTVKALKDPRALEDITDEVTDLDNKVAVGVLNEIIATGSRAQVDQACRTYKFLTGSDYTTKADADRWLAETEGED